MSEDEFAGRGPVAVTVAVLAVPLEGEARVRAAMVAGVRNATGPGQRALRGLGWAVAWVACLPAIVVYEAFAVPLVAGSLALAALLGAFTMVVAAPVLLVAKAIQRGKEPSTAGVVVIRRRRAGDSGMLSP